MVGTVLIKLGVGDIETGGKEHHVIQWRNDGTIRKCPFRHFISIIRYGITRKIDLLVRIVCNLNPVINDGIAEKVFFSGTSNARSEGFVLDHRRRRG